MMGQLLAPGVEHRQHAQLNRSETLDAETATAIGEALERARSAVEAGETDADLAAELNALAADMPADAGDAVTQNRLEELRFNLEGIAATLG